MTCSRAALSSREQPAISGHIGRKRAGQCPGMSRTSPRTAPGHGAGRLDSVRVLSSLCPAPVRGHAGSRVDTQVRALPHPRVTAGATEGHAGQALGPGADPARARYAPGNTPADTRRAASSDPSSAGLAPGLCRGPAGSAPGTFTRSFTRGRRERLPLLRAHVRAGARRRVGGERLTQDGLSRAVEPSPWRHRGAPGASLRAPRRRPGRDDDDALGAP